MNKFYTSLLIFFLSFIVVRSDCQSKHTVYFEALGNGLIYSINYDYGFSDDVVGWGLRLGVGYTPFSDSNFLTIPCMVNYVIGKERHFLEIGAGAVFFTGDAHFLGDYSYDDSFGATMNISYRFQPSQGGLFFKGGVAPVLSDEISTALWPQVALGISF